MDSRNGLTGMMHPTFFLVPSSNETNLHFDQKQKGRSPREESAWRFVVALHPSIHPGQPAQRKRKKTGRLQAGDTHLTATADP